jgi:hypothetical protein
MSRQVPQLASAVMVPGGCPVLISSNEVGKASFTLGRVSRICSEREENAQNGGRRDGGAGIMMKYGSVT